jgi:hypothetical protein
MEDKRIQYYGLMGSTDKAKLVGLLEYVKDNFFKHNEEEMDDTDWKLVS